MGIFGIMKHVKHVSAMIMQEFTQDLLIISLIQIKIKTT